MQLDQSEPMIAIFYCFRIYHMLDAHSAFNSFIYYFKQIVTGLTFNFEKQRKMPISKPNKIWRMIISEIHLISYAEWLLSCDSYPSYPYSRLASRLCLISPYANLTTLLVYCKPAEPALLSANSISPFLAFLAPFWTRIPPVVYGPGFSSNFYRSIPSTA